MPNFATHESLQTASAADARAAIRRGSYAGQTAGLGGPNLQANVAIMAAEFARDFMRFCRRNPKPCPLVGVSDAGDPMMRALGDIDIRTDVPAYHIYRHGRLAGDANDIRALWQNDFVAFALGCSFTFERALVDAGIALWHIKHDKIVPMYRTNIETATAGRFGGPMVVSMRAIPAHQVELASAVSRKFPHAHGAPVHVGDPAAIGIADLDAPNWGDAAPLPADATPVFWACGVTPQVAIERAAIPIVITHKPGHMLITDVDGDAASPLNDSIDSINSINHASTGGNSS